MQDTLEQIKEFDKARMLEILERFDVAAKEATASDCPRARQKYEVTKKFLKSLIEQAFR